MKKHLPHTSTIPRLFVRGFVIVTALLLVQHSFAQAGKQTASRMIASLIADKSYFKARDLYEAVQQELAPIDRLQYGAVIDNAFNRLKASNQKIAELQKNYTGELPDSTEYFLLELQQANYAKLYQYREAAETIEETILRFGSEMKEEEIADFRNTQQIWSALADAPPQEVIVNHRTVLQMHRDKANLMNLDVQRDSVKIGFIFDTGANLSTVTETTARRLNMELKDAAIEVNAITGLKVISKLAVCPEFHLDGIIVRNAVFLVFPDSALAIPQIDYQINGIIGFPVIEAMKEVQITQSGEFIVPTEYTKTKEANLALDFLTPVILIGDEHYTFDSGATSTMLYRNYYEKHSKAIEKRNELKTTEYGGAGGNVKREGYEITWCPVINGKKLKIDHVIVFKDEGVERETGFYGNVGQDVIRNFDKVTMNFDWMFIAFE